MKILLTGFEAFGGETINPAWEACQQVKSRIRGCEIVKLQIPTVFRKGAEAVIQKIEELRPDWVLSIGQAGGRSAIAVELVGINHIDAGIPDNEGHAPKAEKIFDDGENAYFSTLPVKEMVENIKAHGYPAFVSYSAGAYVCNEVLYSLLYYQAKHAPGMKVGFIHVPFTYAQVVEKPNGTAAMGIADIAGAIGYAIEAVIEHQEDARKAMADPQ